MTMRSRGQDKMGLGGDGRGAGEKLNTRPGTWLRPKASRWMVESRLCTCWSCCCGAWWRLGYRSRSRDVIDAFTYSLVTRAVQVWARVWAVWSGSEVCAMWAYSPWWRQVGGEWVGACVCGEVSLM